MKIKTIYSVPMLYGLIVFAAIRGSLKVLAGISVVWFLLMAGFAVLQNKKRLLPAEIRLSAIVTSVIGIFMFPFVRDFCEYTSYMHLTNVICEKLGFSIRRLWVFPGIFCYGISVLGISGAVQLMIGIDGMTFDKILWEKCRNNFFTKKFAVIFSATFCTAILCYLQFLINGHGCADWMNEGYYIYIGANWALSLGRWLIRYLNGSLLNIVATPLIFFVHTLTIALSAYFIIKLWNIRSVWAMIAVSAALVSASAPAQQYQYMYVLMSYGVATLCATLSAYFSVSYYGKGIRFQFVAALFLALSLGCYQSYIGLAAGMILMTMLLKLIRGEGLDRLAKQLGTSVLMGLAGCILYYGIWTVLQKIYGIHVADYSGASSFGVMTILKNLPKTILAAYRGFFSFFTDPMAGRDILLIPVLVLFAVLPIWALKGRSRLLGAAVIAVLPVALNIVCLIAPERGIGELMNHQMNLVIPFLFAVLEINCPKQNSLRFLRNCFVMLVLYFCVNNILCAFATYESLEMSYKRVETAAGEILDTLQEKTDYQYGDTLLIIGYPDESDLNTANPLRPYNYSTKFDSAVFWHTLIGTTMWRNCMLDTFGVATGTVYLETYYDIVASEEFHDMDVFPDGDCVKYIDGCYVVKLVEVAP